MSSSFLKKGNESLLYDNSIDFICGNFSDDSTPNNPILSYQYLTGGFGSERFTYSYLDGTTIFNTNKYFVLGSGFQAHDGALKSKTQNNQTYINNYNRSDTFYTCLTTNSELNIRENRNSSETSVLVKNVIKSFDSDTTNDDKEKTKYSYDSTFEDTDSFFKILLDSKLEIFNTYTDTMDFFDVEIITQDVNNPDTFYTKTIPLVLETGRGIETPSGGV